jgi:hypothetical protein
LGFEKVLLVEGVTDVLTIQQFLRFFGIDHKIVLLPLGGSALINGDRSLELEEIKRITPQVFALIDSELDAPTANVEKARVDFLNVCDRLKIRRHVLERRATENYFTDAAVKAAMGPKYKALGKHEDLRLAVPSWSKSDNWRIARRMSKADLESTDLGKFIHSIQTA